MRFLGILAMIASLAAGMTIARADNVPSLDIRPTCQAIARHASGVGERGGPDVSYRQCVKSELQTRRKLSRRWSTFSSQEKANCVADTTVAGLPSYTDLLTCLQMAKDARSHGFGLLPPAQR